MSGSARYMCLDSCGDQAMVVLSDQQGCLDYRLISAVGTPDNDRVGVFLHSCQELLRAHGCEWSQIAAILVVQGPGRYTGMRLGLSMIAGFAVEKHSRPAIWGIRRDQAYRRLMPQVDLVIMESGKQQAFVAACGKDAGDIPSEPVLWTDEKLVSFVQSSSVQGASVRVLSLLTRAKLQQLYPSFMQEIVSSESALVCADHAMLATALSHEINATHCKDTPWSLPSALYVVEALV